MLAEGPSGPVNALDLLFFLDLARSSVAEIPVDEWLAKPEDRDPDQWKWIREGVLLYLATQSLAAQSAPPAPPPFLQRAYYYPAAEATWIDATVRPEIIVNDVDINQYYIAHPGEYSTPASAQVRYIYVAVPNLAEIAAQREAENRLSEIRGRIASSELTFEQAAQQFSNAPSKTRGGLIPEFTRGTHFPDFEYQAFALKEPGDMSPVFVGNEGVYLIQLISRREAKRVAIDEVRDEIRERLQHEHIRFYYRLQLAKLGEKAYSANYSSLWSYTNLDTPIAIVRNTELTRDQLLQINPSIVNAPVQYIFGPSSLRKTAPGFDHASDATRWRAMQRARDTGDAVATRKLELFSQTDEECDRYGVLVAMPVFSQQMDLDTPAARRQSITGFIFGVFRLSDIVDRALSDFTDTGVSCSISDVTEAGRRDHLHIPAALASGSTAQSPSAATMPRDLIYESRIPVPGRKWVVECWPTEAFLQTHTSLLPLLSLLAGLLGTGMLALLIWVVDGRADAVERTVVERTAALRDANEELEAEVRERMAAESQLAEHARNLEESNRQLEQARVELQRQAMIDPLTGVMNRHSFGERFASEWSRTCRLKLPLSCILLDVDFFKKVNDTHGHPMGDEVLRTLARLLREQSRDYDCVARFGGEEFCVLLPSTYEEEAVEWAERLRKIVAANPLRDGNDTFYITASMGVASRTGDVKGPEELLNQADEALLIAKRQGRNRVIAFSDLHRLATAALDSGGSVFRGARAGDIMTPVLVHLTPHQPLMEAARLLLSLRLDSVPVIDEEGRTLGIIGEEDLTAQILSGKGWRQVVGEVMNTTPVTYDSATPAADICEFLSRVTVRRVIILHAGRPVGLISRSTLIRWLRNSLLSNPLDPQEDLEESTTPEMVSERLRSTIDRLTSQISALQQGVESSQGVVMPVVVSAATRIQELVDDALMLSAEQDADSVFGYATMGAVLS